VRLKRGKQNMILFSKNITILKYGLLLVLLSSFYTIKGQNLVRNWSFEDTLHCPTGTGCPIINVKLWHSPTPNTPDYYNSCGYYCNVPGTSTAYFQYVKQGQAYTGIFLWNGTYTNDRDYIQGQLTDTLIKNRWYCAGFWVSKAETAKYAVRDIGMFISKTAVGSLAITNLPFIPQICYNSPQYITDTANWVLISGSFQAQGGEKYLTIGNFKDDAHTDTLQCDTTSWKANIAYYLIDAVFLYDCSQSVQAYAGEDASICGDEIAQIGSDANPGCQYKWIPSTGLDNDTLANPTAKPTQTTTYCLTMTDPYYQITTDTVVVEVTDDCYIIDFIPNIFTPNGDGQNEVFRVRGENIEKLILQVYNRWGNKVFEGNDPQASWDGKYNKQPCAEGVYYYVADVTFSDGKMESRKGSVTLIR
jgi:gliding motility-associated-like protein